ncbi:hypothetical protein Bca101_062226 [Brassica carinata]
MRVDVFTWRRYSFSHQQKSALDQRYRERERERLGFVIGAKDDRGGAQRPSGEESKGEVQRRRHDRRSEEARGGADRYASGEDSDSEVVQHLQGSYHSQGLRDPRRHGSRALLQLGEPEVAKQRRHKCELKECLLICTPPYIKINETKNCNSLDLLATESLYAKGKTVVYSDQDLLILHELFQALSYPFREMTKVYTFNP